jgi:hypothetical protein
MFKMNKMTERTAVARAPAPRAPKTRHRLDPGALLDGTANGLEAPVSGALHLFAAPTPAPTRSRRAAR